MVSFGGLWSAWSYERVLVKVTYLKVKVGLCEVLVQSRRQVLSCGQDDAAEREHTVVGS